MAPKWLPRVSSPMGGSWDLKRPRTEICRSKATPFWPKPPITTFSFCHPWLFMENPCLPLPKNRFWRNSINVQRTCMEKTFGSLSWTVDSKRALIYTMWNMFTSLNRLPTWPTKNRSLGEAHVNADKPVWFSILREDGLFMYLFTTWRFLLRFDRIWCLRNPCLICI